MMYHICYKMSCFRIEGLTKLALFNLLILRAAFEQVSSVSLSSTPNSTSTKETVYVLLGSNVTLSCQHGLNATSKRIIWKFHDTILFSGTEKFTTVEFKDVKITDEKDLFIPKFEYKYQGYYTCRLGNEPPIHQFNVTVEVLPSVSIKFAGDFVYSPNKDTLSSTKSYQMECHANRSSHIVTLQWFVNGSMYSGRESATWNLDQNDTIHTESVILYRPKKGDTVVSCQATGQSNGIVTARMPVKVSAESSERQQPVRMFKNYGENVSLSCTSSTLMSMWDYPPRSNAKTTKDGEIIHIDHIRIENEGIYTCYKAGETTVTIQLTVEVPTDIVMVAWDENMDDNLTVSMHKSYKISCIAIGLRLPARVSWRVNEAEYFRGLNTLKWASEGVPGTAEMNSSIVYTPSRGDRYITCTTYDRQRSSPNKDILYIANISFYRNTIFNESVNYNGSVSICCNISQGDGYLWELRTHFGRTKDPLISSNIKEHVNAMNNGSDLQSCLDILAAKTNNSGYYSCFRLNESTNVFQLDVKVTHQIIATFEDNLEDNITVYRYRDYDLHCFVYGAYPAATISWSINGVKTRDRVFNKFPHSSFMGHDLYDSESFLQYHPSDTDRNVTCEVKAIDGSYHERATFDIKEVVSVEEKFVTVSTYQGDNVTIICSIPVRERVLKWKYEGNQLLCGFERCNVFNNINIKPTRNHINLNIVSIGIKNDGIYSCYHGLEEIETYRVDVIANLSVYLMPSFKRIFPDTIEVYEGTQYLLDCIVNSTNEITSILWQVNGKLVPEDESSLVTDNSSKKLNQVTSVLNYTPLISHVTISCVAEDRNGTTDYQTVKVYFVLSLLKKIALWVGVTLVLLLFMATLVCFCSMCKNCAKRKTEETSLELLERRKNLTNVDKSAWRRSMQAFSKRSGSRYGIIRRSRMLIETTRVEVDEGVEVYDKFINQSFRRSVVPHSRLCFVMQLKSGTFTDRWMGTLRQRIKAKTGSFISSVSDTVSEDKKFRWDMFVKSVIELPSTRHIASIIGISMQNGRLYLIQEFLQVENLKTYFETNLKLLTKAGLISKNVVRIARGVIDGMEYLSLNEFCHPALSIQKVLISSDDECKLYDFCLHEDATDKIESIISKNKPSYSNLAIETMLRDEYTILSDVWSVGTALWEIFSLGEEPFKGLQQGDIKRLIERGHQLPQPAHCSRPFYHVMMDCWIDSPERPSMSSIRDTFKNAIREYIEIVDASGDQISENRLGSRKKKTYIEPPNTYNIPAGTEKGSDENIYEKMDGTLRTFSE